jgi:peptide/nickel transport system substrate-binding protein
MARTPRLAPWTLAVALVAGTMGIPALTAAPAAAAASGTVTVGVTEEPTTLNPMIPQTGVTNGEVQYSMFRNLFMITPKDQLAPDLASVVPTVANGGISKDGLVYTFHLRPALEWSSGQPLTSRDVWETYQLAVNPKVNPSPGLGWSDIKTFSIASNTEFRITLKQPFAPLLITIFSGPGIVPYYIFHNMPPSQVTKAAWNSAPTAADGPYMFKSWQSGQAITVVRNPHWYGPTPKSAAIVFKIVPDDNSMLVQAQAGNINAWPDFPVNFVKQVQSLPGAQVHAATGTGWEAPVVNFRNPILRDLRVREALELSIDRPALVKTLFGPYAKVAVADQAPGSWGYNNSLKPWPYDPNLAKRLLTEAGWKVGKGGYRYRDGQELTLTWLSFSGNPIRQEIERLVQYWWKGLGINLTIKNAPSNVLFGGLVQSGKGWDLFDVESTGSGDPSVLDYDLFATKGFLNFGAYSNPTVDRILTEMQSQPSQARRAQLFRAVETILRNQLPMLFLYYPEDLEATFHLSGFTENPWSSDTWDCWNWQAT